MTLSAFERSKDHPFRLQRPRDSLPLSTHGQWFERPIEDPAAAQIWGYSDQLSYEPGERLALHVSTGAAQFAVEILRDGATLQRVHREEGIAGAYHQTPEDASVTGCGWPIAWRFVIPEDWPSGGYRLCLTAVMADGREVAHDHFFLLRPKPETDKAGRLLLIAATGTWLAYNDWGGSNHYEGITGPEGWDYAPAVSIHRPWARGFISLPAEVPRVPLREPPGLGAPLSYPHIAWAWNTGHSKKYASAGWAAYDGPFARWAEAKGYALDIISQTDLHDRPHLLEGYAAIVSVGHDEYWSWRMRDHLDAYVEGGGRLARFAGNFLWQTRLEDEGATQVCYKYRAMAEDPLREGRQRHLTTTCWEAPIVGRPGAESTGLNATRGVYAGWGGCAPRGPGGFIVYRPDHWALAESGLYYGDVIGGSSRVFGYEVDGLDYEMRDGLPFPTSSAGAPEGLEILAMGLANNWEEDRGTADSPPWLGTEDAEFIAEALYGEATEETLSRTKYGNGMIVAFEKGAGQVFHAGSCEWVAGLIDGDPFVERITATVLNRFLRQ